MPNQTDVQQLIQSLTPSAVNNGNPNTVYNNPMPQGGYIPPTYDPGTNTWRVNPAPTNNVPNWQQLAMSQPQGWGWQAPFQPAPPITTDPVNPGGAIPVTPVPPPEVPVTPPASSSPIPPRRTGGGDGEGGAGCVAIDQEIYGFVSPEGVEVGDIMPTVNEKNFSMTEHEVTYSQTKEQPCVVITTESGAALKCSLSAPLLKDGNVPVLAEAVVEGDRLAVQVDGMFDFSPVTSVEHVGNFLVQHITCGNQYFLAGNGNGKYILHHNAKMVEGTGMDLLGLMNSLNGQFGWSSDSGGFGAESMGNHSMFGGGTFQRPVNNQSTTPLGQGIIDAFGPGGTPIQGQPQPAWNGSLTGSTATNPFGGANLPAYDNSWYNYYNPSDLLGGQPAYGTELYPAPTLDPNLQQTGGGFWNWLDNNIAGNLYDENSGTWNTGNIVGGVVEGLTGIPVMSGVLSMGTSNLFNGSNGMGSNYARSQLQQEYDRGTTTQRSDMVQRLATQYNTTPEAVLQIIGR